MLIGIVYLGKIYHISRFGGSDVVRSEEKGFLVRLRVNVLK